jgi:hypothetical protein
LKQSFLSDKRGIALVGVVAVAFIFVSSIIWLAGALVVNRTYDAFAPIFARMDVESQIISQHAVNAYGVSIVVVDVLLLVWWGLSAQKVESQEYAGGVM